MQTYEDLESLSGAFRMTIDWIVNGNRTLRGEVADAAGFVRETINLKCLNAPGRIDEIAVRVPAALRALVQERQPTEWLHGAITEIMERATAEPVTPPFIEAFAPVYVSEEPVPEATIDPADVEEEDDDESSTIGDAVARINGAAADAEGYIAALQAQLVAHGVTPVARGADYVHGIAQSIVAQKVVLTDDGRPLPPSAAPHDIQKIDGVTEV